MKNFKSNLAKYYTNKIGWKTKRKIVVFESDDWGSIRMPNKKAQAKLSIKNSKIVKDVYSQFDSIAQEKDLELLFETLLKFQDFKGNHPVITANTIVANPDFQKIKESNFSNYQFETFNETIKKLNEGERILKLWQKGIDLGVFKPQLHGREHLNVLLWLEELKLGNKDLLTAFDEKCFGIPYTSILQNKRKNVMAALDYVGIEGERKFHKEYINDAAYIFKEYFGYSSKSFIAPAYIWHHTIEETLKENGIEIIQGLPIQYLPNLKTAKFKKKLHYIGQINKHKQFYITRNSFFEPTSKPDFDWVNFALKKIETAFKYNKPAIIGTHRINFMGSLVQKNRDENLRFLEVLLKNIIKKWPTVEFMTSDHLGNLICRE